MNIPTVKMLISSNTTQNQSVENFSSVIQTSKNALRPVLPTSSVGLTGYVSPKQILPFPKAPPRKRQNRRRKTIAFTDTPQKQKIEEELAEEQNQLLKKKKVRSS